MSGRLSNLLRSFREMWGEPEGDGHAEVRPIPPPKMSNAELTRRLDYALSMGAPGAQPMPEPPQAGRPGVSRQTPDGRLIPAGQDRPPARLAQPRVVLSDYELQLRTPLRGRYEARYRLKGEDFGPWRPVRALHRFPAGTEDVQVRKVVVPAPRETPPIVPILD